MIQHADPDERRPEGSRGKTPSACTTTPSRRVAPPGRTRRKATAERSCIGCGEKTGKAELLRFVRLEDGTLLFDEAQRIPGRGGYLCPREACFAAAFKKRRFSARFRREVREDLSSLLDRVRHRLQTDAPPSGRVAGRPGACGVGGRTDGRIRHPRPT